jgi:prevent-host-death family protein
MAGGWRTAATVRIRRRVIALGLLKDYIWSIIEYRHRNSHPETLMRYSTQIKPISYLKANAAEVLHELAANREPLVITQNGEAKAVIQDVTSYEETQETLALLKILALGNQQIDQNRVRPLTEVIGRLRSRKTPEAPQS